MFAVIKWPLNSTVQWLGLNPSWVSLGLRLTSDWHNNLVVRLNLTADQQLNPLRPVFLWNTAAMCNDRASQCFKWSCVERREASELLAPLISSHVNLVAASLLSQKICTLNPAVIQTAADSPLNLGVCSFMRGGVIYVQRGCGVHQGSCDHGGQCET